MAALCIMGMLSGCVGKTASWDADKPAVVESIRNINGEQADQSETIKQLEQRIIELDAQVKKHEAVIEALSASLESIRKSSPRIARTTTQREKKLAEKLQQVEKKLQNSSQKGGNGVDPNAEKNAYTNAYLALKSGRYDEATGAFKALLAKFPKGEYSDQALYWLGESYLALNKPGDAISAFKSVASNYPDSGKHAAALLKMASTYVTMKRSGDAKAVLQRLLREHPESSAAEEGRKLLQSLQGSKK